VSIGFAPWTWTSSVGPGGARVYNFDVLFDKLNVGSVFKPPGLDRSSGCDFRLEVEKCVVSVVTRVAPLEHNQSRMCWRCV
jgi:hypothetical protein